LTKRKNIAHGGRDEDRPLVDRAIAGDREALGDLFVRHAPTVRRLLVSVVGPDSELDDLVQEVFLQVQRSLPRFRGEARFSTWLHQLTVYAAYNYLRKPRGRFVPTEPRIIASNSSAGSENAYERLVNRETIKRLYAALDRIKPKKRLAFILYAVHGMSAHEVAEMVNAPVPTVKSRIWFAKRELLKKARQDAYLVSLLSELKEDE
jgi:RNA polymerase sigma-70 factor (ECF subfamily)